MVPNHAYYHYTTLRNCVTGQEACVLRYTTPRYVSLYPPLRRVADEATPLYYAPQTSLPVYVYRLEKAISRRPFGLAGHCPIFFPPKRIHLLRSVFCTESSKLFDSLLERLPGRKLRNGHRWNHNLRLGLRIDTLASCTLGNTERTEAGHRHFVPRAKFGGYHIYE